jgi:galactokinase
MTTTAADQNRIERLAEAVARMFPDTPAWGGDGIRGALQIVRAPGRVNLLGNETDYDEGLVLTAAIDMDVWLAYRRRSDGEVAMASLRGGDRGSFRIDRVAPQLLPRGARPAAGTATWLDYVAGTAWSLREAGLPVRGFDGVVHGLIPESAGLGSAAALELAAAHALLGDETIAAAASLAAIAQRAEREYVGVDGGIVDQLASAAGREGRALLVDCRSLDVRHVTMPYGLRVVVCDTGWRPDGGALLDERRAECARAVALLSEKMPGLCSLRDLDDRSLKRHRRHLQATLARRAEHVVCENARVMAAVPALHAGDLDTLGLLFAESHSSLRRLFGVGSAALDAMVEVAGAVPGVVAARMMGGGLAGWTVNLVLDEAVPRLEAAVRNIYGPRTGLDGRAYPLAVVDGAGPVLPGI